MIKRILIIISVISIVFCFFVPVNAASANLLPSFSGNSTSCGLTFTDLGNGSLQLNGDRTAQYSASSYYIARTSISIPADYYFESGVYKFDTGLSDCDVRLTIQYKLLDNPDSETFAAVIENGSSYAFTAKAKPFSIRVGVYDSKVFNGEVITPCLTYVNPSEDNVGAGFNLLVSGMGNIFDWLKEYPVLLLGVSMFCIGGAIAIYKRLV